VKTSCATQCFEKLFSTYLDWVFSWFLNLEIKFLLILELFLTQSWNHSLGNCSWLNLEIILLSFLSSSLLSSKQLESILIHHHHEVYFYNIYRPIVSFQNGLKICVFSKSFFEIFSLVIDYRFLVIDYTFIFWRFMSFQSIFLKCHYW